MPPAEILGVVDAEDVGVGVAAGVGVDDGVGDDFGVGDVAGVGVGVVVLPRFRLLTCTGVVLSRFCSISQLAIFIVSPGPDRPVRLQGQAVIESSRNGNNITQAAYLHRGIPICIRICSVSQLAKLIRSPRQYCSI